MNGLRTHLCWLGLLALLGGSLGCAPSQSFRTSFMPPAAPGARSYYAPDPPDLAAPLEITDSPRFISPLPPVSIGSRADVLIREAEWHFQAGRSHYQAGDARAARREFDRAIDVLLSAPEDAVLQVPVDKKLEDLVDA